MRPYNKMEVIIHQNQYLLTAANSAPLFPPVPCTGLALSLLLESYLNKLEEPEQFFHQSVVTQRSSAKCGVSLSGSWNVFTIQESSRF